MKIAPTWSSHGFPFKVYHKLAIVSSESTWPFRPWLWKVRNRAQWFPRSLTHKNLFYNSAVFKPLTALLSLDLGFLSTDYYISLISEYIPELSTQMAMPLEVGKYSTECWLAREPADLDSASNHLPAGRQSSHASFLLWLRKGSSPCLSRVPFTTDIVWFWKWLVTIVRSQKDTCECWILTKGELPHWHSLFAELTLERNPDSPDLTDSASCWGEG